LLLSPRLRIPGTSCAGVSLTMLSHWVFYREHCGSNHSSVTVEFYYVKLKK